MSKSNKVDATLDGSDTESDLSMTFSSNKKSICEEYPLASVKWYGTRVLPVIS